MPALRLRLLLMVVLRLLQWWLGPASASAAAMRQVPRQLCVHKGAALGIHLFTQPLMHRCKHKRSALLEPLTESVGTPAQLHVQHW